MLGYYKDDAKTKEVIDEKGYFHTGDIGVIDSDGFLKITDRKKEIFKLSGGKYIAPQMIENKLKASNLIDQVMVIGANEKFASALISPNFPLMHDWAAEHKIHFENNIELVKKPEVYDKIQKEVKIINKTLGLHEQISRIRLVCEEWTPASGELSPTLKLRRNMVAVKYQHLIDDIYSAGKN
jgi:long-chain acyl-CoA synthetase